MTVLSDYRVDTELPLRQVLYEDFKIDVPIKGGWGYTREEAIIIDHTDPLVAGVPANDEAAIQNYIIEKRIYEELIVFRPIGGKFSGITWELKSHETATENGKVFEYLVFAVTAHEEIKYFELQKEYEQMKNEPSFDLDRNLRELEANRIYYEGEYWFDVTGFVANADTKR